MTKNHTERLLTGIITVYSDRGAYYYESDSLSLIGTLQWSTIKQLIPISKTKGTRWPSADGPLSNTHNSEYDMMQYGDDIIAAPAWVRSVNGDIWSTMLDNSGSLHILSLLNGGKQRELQVRTDAIIPISSEKHFIYTLMRLIDPNVIFVSRERKGKNGLLEIAVPSGELKNVYYPPGGSWPPDVMPMSDSDNKARVPIETQIGKDRVLILFSGDKGIAGGLWARTGGECLAWMRLSQRGEIISVLSGPRLDSTSLLIRNSDEYLVIRASDGKIMGREHLISENVPPPYFVRIRRDKWGVKNVVAYKQICRRILFGGNNYWPSITSVQLPNSEVKMILSMRERLAEQRRLLFHIYPTFKGSKMQNSEDQ